MAKLDTLVTTHMNERLFQPERLAIILSSLSSQRSEKADAVNVRRDRERRILHESGVSGFSAAAGQDAPLSQVIPIDGSWASA